MSSFQSFVSSSVSFSFSTSSSNGQRTGQVYRQEYHSTPQGTITRTTSQKLGRPAVEETRHYDAYGRELLGSGQPRHRPAIHQQPSGAIIEELDDSEADPVTQTRMIESGQAKRKGGA